MVYRFDLTYDEIVNILDVHYKAGSTNGYTILAGIYEMTDFNFMLQFLLPNKVKANITNDVNRLGSNLTTIKRIRFTKFFFIPYWDLRNLIRDH